MRKMAGLQAGPLPQALLANTTERISWKIRCKLTSAHNPSSHHPHDVVAPHPPLPPPPPQPPFPSIHPRERSETAAPTGKNDRQVVHQLSVGALACAALPGDAGGLARPETGGPLARLGGEAVSAEPPRQPLERLVQRVAHHPLQDDHGGGGSGGGGSGGWVAGVQRMGKQGTHKKEGAGKKGKWLGVKGGEDASRILGGGGGRGRRRGRGPAKERDGEKWGECETVCGCAEVVAAARPAGGIAWTVWAMTNVSLTYSPLADIQCI